ncbi:MAG: siderophore-interacting protein [Thiothrix sp.]|nr:siderophore-interacting protein [Thiothrix sp.]HPE59791.1 siderophore-interacting protein [Thiolinea sp.]
MNDRRTPKALTVVSSKRLTPNMQRVTLAGTDLESLPDGSEGDYIKLLFAQGGEVKPLMRTYTIARQRKNPHEIDVDFMLHGHGTVDGIAAPWSLSTQVGDGISIFGPGPGKVINLDADWFLLGADMTALPALTANLKTLPADAKGVACIEILSAEDEQVLEKPEKVDVHWVVNPDAGSEESPLFTAIRQTTWHDGQAAVWVACEFKAMKKIRQYLKQERQLATSHLYTSSYWKKGISEDQHKVVKREDAEAADTQP